MLLHWGPGSIAVATSPVFPKAAAMTGTCKGLVDKSFKRRMEVKVLQRRS